MSDADLPSDADLAEVVRHEVRLLDPRVRADPQAVRALLHPEFREVGSSGRTWDRRAILAALAADPGGTTAEARDLVPVRLAADVVLLTYSAHRPDRVTRRVSLWVRDAHAPWRLRYHQGTVAPEGHDPSARG